MITTEIKKLLEKQTPDGKQALMRLAEEVEKLQEDVLELKKRCERK